MTPMDVQLSIISFSIDGTLILWNGEKYGDYSLFGPNVFAASDDHPAADSVCESRNPQIGRLQDAEENVVDAEIGLGTLGDVVLDEGPAAGAEDVIVYTVDGPVEVRSTPLKNEKLEQHYHQASIAKESSHAIITFFKYVRP